MKIAVDTNVLVYSLNLSSPYHQGCRRFLIEHAEDIVIANQSLFEYIRVVTHPKHPNPVSFKTALDYVEKYQTQFQVVYETDRDVQIFRELSLKYHLGSNRIFDTKLVATLISNNVNKLATVNIKDFRVFKEIEIIDSLKFT